MALELVETLQRHVLEGIYGWRNGEWLFSLCYSNRNPRNAKECADLCINGIWHPVFIKYQGHWLAQHHLADRSVEQGWAFSSGFVMEEARGKHLPGLRADMWQLARHYFECLGFVHLYCVAYTNNAQAQEWIEGPCAFHRAAILRNAVTDHHGQERDVVLYAQRDEDIPMARETAQSVFAGDNMRMEAA